MKPAFVSAVLSAAAIVALCNGCSSDNSQQAAVRLEAPQPGQQVSSTLTVRGEARGFWFFEATLPVQVQDHSGHVLLDSYVEARGDWMTEDFVGFEKTLQLPAVEDATDAVFVVMRNNPSDLPEHDAQFRVPIRLVPGNRGSSPSGGDDDRGPRNKPVLAGGSENRDTGAGREPVQRLGAG